MKTRDEAFLEYEETLAHIDKQAHEAKEKAKTTLREQLDTLRDIAHKELKDIRVIEQKTRRSKKNAR